MSEGRLVVWSVCQNYLKVNTSIALNSFPLALSPNPGCLSLKSTHHAHTQTYRHTHIYTLEEIWKHSQDSGEIIGNIIVTFLGFDVLLHVILLSNVAALNTPPQRLAALRLHPLHLTLNQRVQLLSKLKYFIFVRLIKKGSLACTFCGHCTSGFLGSCGSGSFLCRQDNQSPRDSRYASPPHDRSFDPSSVKEFLRILIS